MSLSEMIASSPIAAVICDPAQRDTPIIDCNAAFEKLTGYSRADILGRNCRFLSGPQTQPWLTESLRTGIRQARPVMVEILNYKKDGTPFRNAVLVAPIFGENGKLEYFLGSQMEVAEPERDLTARRAEAHSRIAALSPRQRQVLIQLAAGQINKQIAYTLGVSERTIKMHRAALFQTLGVTTAAEAIRMAIEAGY